MLDRIERSVFAENLKTKFKASLEGMNAVELELVEIVDNVSTPRQEQFALEFHGPANTFLPQQMYRVEHESIGTFDLLLVPVGKHENGFAYEAVFNRLIPKSE
ncbi:MAG TPA: hypothetical protein VF658_14715 [Pyrinomonadaceae bacterium]